MTLIRLDEVKQEVKTSKNGKKYTYCSIKANGEYRTGFGNNETRGWQAGDDVDVDLFEEEYNGKIYKKFKTKGTSAPKGNDDLFKTAMVAKITAMEKRLEALELFVFPQQEEPVKTNPDDDLPF